MTVNLSARQFAADDLVGPVTDALANAGLDPTTLVLEMTETALIHDATVAARRLHELRRPRVRLAIDDFGTGFVPELSAAVPGRHLEDRPVVHQHDNRR